MTSCRIPVSVRMEQGFLTSVVALLTQVGETALRSASTEVAAMFVECCATVRKSGGF